MPPLLFNQPQRSSYQDSQANARKRNRYILFLVLLFLTLQLVSAFFFRTYRISENGMAPTARKGDFIMATPFGLGPYIGGARLPQFREISRGDVVLCQTPGPQPRSRLNFLNPLARFASGGFFYFKSPKEKSGLADLNLKRIIALPGDTVRMEGYVIFVKPKGQRYFLSEFEAGKRPYETTKGPVSESLNAFMPLSPHFDEIILGDNEYFAAGDNRLLVNDSRSFGPISKKEIYAKALYIYWGLGRLGSF